MHGVDTRPWYRRLTRFNGKDYLKTKQSDIEATLTKIILATDPFPVPGRVLRNIISRCFISIYTRLEAKTLFDTLQSLIKVVSDFKTADRDSHKSCVHSLLLLHISGSLIRISELPSPALVISWRCLDPRCVT